MRVLFFLPLVFASVDIRWIHSLICMTGQEVPTDLARLIQAYVSSPILLRPEEMRNFPPLLPNETVREQDIQGNQVFRINYHTQEAPFYLPNGIRFPVMRFLHYPKSPGVLSGRKWRETKQRLIISSSSPDCVPEILDPRYYKQTSQMRPLKACISTHSGEFRCDVSVTRRNYRTHRHKQALVAIYVQLRGGHCSFWLNEWSRSIAYDYKECHEALYAEHAEESNPWY